MKNLNKYFDNNTNNTVVSYSAKTLSTKSKGITGQTFVPNKRIKHANSHSKTSKLYFRKSSIQEKEEKKARSKRRNKNLLLLSLSKKSIKTVKV